MFTEFQEIMNQERVLGEISVEEYILQMVRAYPAAFAEG